MKRFKFILIAVPFFLFSMCDKNEENEVITNDYDINISAVYFTENNPNQEINDTGSKIYIYYENEIYGFEYEGEGVFKKDDLTVKPVQTSEIDKTGKAVITPKYIDRHITIVIESAFYKRLSIDTHTSAKQPIKIDLKNYP